MILLFLGLVAMTLSFVGNAQAALPEDQPKGPAIFHSLAGGDSILIDTSGLVCTWWRQLWRCGNLYHVINYKDNGDGVISACDYIKTEMTEAYGVPQDPPYVSWKHIERVTATLKLRKLGFSDSMFVEFTGGMDSISRVTEQDPRCTWWHEVWPDWCRYYHLSSWGDNGSGSLDSCDTIDLVEYWHVIDVTEEAGQLWLTMEYLEGSEVQNRILTFSGGIDPDSVVRALADPVCTWWHEEHPDTCNWWHINSWGDAGQRKLGSCDTIDVVKAEHIEWWHVVRVTEVSDSLWLILENPEVPSDTMLIKFSGSGYSDSVDFALDSLVCTWWHEIWPNFCQWWHIKSWHDNGNHYVDSCDTIDMVRVQDVEWWHVLSVTEDAGELRLTIDDIGGVKQIKRFLVFSGGLHPDSVNRALTEPVCTWWHEIHPDTCQWWHINSWIDTPELDSCDTVDFKTWWHVEDIATDIEVITTDEPPEGAIPTTTEWGMIVLAALLVASAVFVYLRRKKVMVSR